MGDAAGDVTKHIYRDAAGQEIEVVAPWSAHSGNIPPPTIEFSTGSFVYQGSTVENRADGTKDGA